MAWHGCSFNYTSICTWSVHALLKVGCSHHNRWKRDKTNRESREAQQVLRSERKERCADRVACDAAAEQNTLSRATAFPENPDRQVLESTWLAADLSTVKSTSRHPNVVFTRLKERAMPSDFSAVSYTHELRCQKNTSRHRHRENVRPSEDTRKGTEECFHQKEN